MAGNVTPEASARFAREAEIAVAIRHSNLVAIHDIGVMASGALYIVMELVRGGTLEAHRKQFGALPFAVTVLRQVAEGLSALHARGIVHRDLKPANILLSDDEGVKAKIADFGITRIAADPDPTVTPEAATVAERHPRGSGLTQTGMWLGTPNYMAPELTAGVNLAKPAADIFAFGIIAHEILTGGPPFDAPPFYDALAGRPFAAARALTYDALEQGCRDLIDRCLAARPGERPTARELADALSRPASSERTTAA